MDQGNRKLGLFYQYQIAKIAKLARKQPHPGSRRRLDNLLNKYIDMLLAIPSHGDRTTDAKAGSMLASQLRRGAAVAIVAHRRETPAIGSDRRRSS